MPFTRICLDFELNDLSIESKNARIGVRTRKLWPSKVKVANFAWVCEIVQNSPCINECNLEQLITHFLPSIIDNYFKHI